MEETEFEDSECVQKNMMSALKEFHEFSKQWMYRWSKRSADQEWPLPPGCCSEGIFAI